MLDAFAENLAEIIRTSTWLAPLAALLGGLLTAANPCVLAAAPLMVGYVAGQENKSLRRSFSLSLTFTLGLTVTFLVMWLVVRSFSFLLPTAWWRYIAAVVCLLMGLHLLGVFRLRFPALGGWQPKRRGFVGALLLGLLFGLISMPCAGPVLIALLSLTQLGGVTFAFGLLLLVAYSLGHCGLVLIGGTSIGMVQKLADSKGWTRGTDVLRRVAGVLIAGVGVWLLFFG
jgi:cytochrome c biogenesis protein CcdA